MLHPDAFGGVEAITQDHGIDVDGTPHVPILPGAVDPLLEHLPACGIVQVGRVAADRLRYAMIQRIVRVRLERRAARVLDDLDAIPGIVHVLFARLVRRHVAVGVECGRGCVAHRGDLVLLVVAARLRRPGRRHRIPVAERVEVPRLRMRTSRKATQLIEVVVTVAFVESRVDAIPLREAVAIAVVGVSESIRRRRTLLPVLIYHPTERIEADVLVATRTRAGAKEGEIDSRLWVAASHDGAQAEVVVALKGAGQFRQRREPTGVAVHTIK